MRARRRSSIPSDINVDALPPVVLRKVSWPNFHSNFLSCILERALPKPKMSNGASSTERSRSSPSDRPCRSDPGLLFLTTVRSQKRGHCISYSLASTFRCSRESAQRHSPPDHRPLPRSNLSRRPGPCILSVEDGQSVPKRVSRDPLGFLSAARSSDLKAGAT